MRQGPVLRVPDVRVALGQLARWYREALDLSVVGITGSVGKTTTKELLACAVLVKLSFAGGGQSRLSQVFSRGSDPVQQRFTSERS